MDCAIDCTLDELTGSGSVATAASIADCRMATVSGEKDALAKSFTALFPANASNARLAMQAAPQRRCMCVVPGPAGLSRKMQRGAAGQLGEASKNNLACRTG